jgi:nucleotide-binding universal stress UspA family protein
MRILIAINGSPQSEQAVRLGAQIVQRTGEAPTLLFVGRRGNSRQPTTAGVAVDFAVDLWPSEVPEAQPRVRIGHPAREIVSETEETSYGLVIIGAEGNRNRIPHFLHDSITAHVVQHASCPVLVAKGRIGPIRRILLCDSGADGNPVLSHFARLARLFGSEGEVTILHVMSQISAGPGVRGRQLRASAKDLIEERSPEGELLERDLRTLEDLGIHARAEVRHGLVVDEILTEAKSGDYDLVVIGAHRSTGWQHLLLDDLVHQLLPQLDRSVLVAR